MKTARSTGRPFGPRPDLFTHTPETDRYISAPHDAALSLAIIGVGINGREHLRNTFHEGRATVRGVFDTEPRSIEAATLQFQEFAPGQELIVYDSIAHCCADPDVDGIIIATPNHTHLELVQQVAPARKPILLEKPMATTLEDAWRIVEIARDHPAVFQIGLQYRYKAMYAESMYEANVRKSVGDIKTISISEHRVPFLDKVGQWNKFARYSGNTLVEKCCHYFDLFNLFAQSKPVRVYASGSMAVNFKDFDYDGAPADVLDNAMVTVDYSNGVTAGFDLCMFAPMFYERFTLCGDEGRLSAVNQDDFLKGSPTCSLQVLSNGFEPARTMTPEYPGAIETFGHDGATYFEHVSFVDGILGKQTNSATPLDGFWSVVVGVAAQESIVTGNPVDVEHMLRETGIDPAAVG